MPDITTYQTVVCKFSDKEYRLMMKALAHFAGLKVARPDPEEVTEAKELNKTLLSQRKANLTEQLKMAEGALQRALEGEGS